MRDKSKLLSQTLFAILLALSNKPTHGYALIEQIGLDSSGRLSLGAGTLYGAIKQLRDDNYIEEIPELDNERRRQYRLTKKGWDKLESDLNYYRSIVLNAKKRHISAPDFI